jgi:hypothetical protein
MTLADEILVRGLDDIIQMAEIVSVARFQLGIQDQTALEDEVHRALLYLVGDRFAIFGDLVEDAPRLWVDAWAGTAENVVTRAMNAWRELGTHPNLGEVGWLELTDDGRRVARTRVEP